MSTITTIALTALSLTSHLKEASGKRSDVYGISNELYCGDVGKPQACSKGATTASGAGFDPDLPSVALALPRGFKIRPTLIWVKTLQSKCQAIWLTDKKNPKHSKHRPWDISVAAAKLLGFKGTRDTLHLCNEVKPL